MSICLFFYSPSEVEKKTGPRICIHHTRTEFVLIVHFLTDHCRKTNPMKVPFMGVWRGEGRVKHYVVNPLVDPGGCSGIKLPVVLHSSKTASTASHNYSKEPPENFL